MARMKLAAPGLWGIKVLGLIYLVSTRNPETGAHFAMLATQWELVTLVKFVIIWGATIAALIIVAAHPNTLFRVFWGAMIAMSTAVQAGYYQATQTRLNMVDILTFWQVDEYERAYTFYQSAFLTGFLVLALGLVVFLLPPPAVSQNLTKWICRAWFVPMMPLAMLSLLFWLKGGWSLIAMPSHFSTTSLVSLALVEKAVHKAPKRAAVAWQPSGPKLSQNIVVLMDESIRGDYLDFTPHNSFTPALAKLSSSFVNFGAAASTGNCSNYSNALVRFGASRRDISATANSNATLFEYAKRAGYRTVFIDAQAQYIAFGNNLQNFMTLQEAGAIDEVFSIKGVAPELADFELSKILGGVLNSGQPTFVYANKNGAHFPYDLTYPHASAKFHPTMAEAGINTVETRIASYRNAISWSVDHFFEVLFETVNLDHTTVIYTSDHGQRLTPGGVTHCATTSVNPTMGIVPLFVYTHDQMLKEKFAQGAANSVRQASSFMIAPTVYKLMGYLNHDIETAYDESMFAGTRRPPSFTSGDIFGLFGRVPELHEIDLSKSYLELR